MNSVATVKRIRIYLSDGDRLGAKPTYLAVVEYLRRENARGATVLRAIAGFGGSGRIRVGESLDGANLPLVVEWMDAPGRVERILPGVKALVPHAPITAEDVQVLQGEAVDVRELPEALTAADVMTRDLFTVTPRTPLREVVEGLLGKRYRAVPVVVDGIPAGIITNGDLVERGGLGARIELLAELERDDLEEILDRLSGARRLAGDVMTREPFVVQASTRLPRVAEVMLQRKLKRLPVIDGAGKLVGMVSRVDLLRLVGGGDVVEETAVAGGEGTPAARAGLAGELPLSRVMRRDVPTVGPDASLAEVCQAIVSTRLHRALVVDEESRVIGQITDAALLERLSPGLRPRALGTLMHRAPLHGNGTPRAAEVMTADVPAAGEQTTVREAIARMLRGSQKILAVTDGEGRLVGVVDRADLLRGLLPAAVPTP